MTDLNWDEYCRDQEQAEAAIAGTEQRIELTVGVLQKISDGHVSIDLRTYRGETWLDVRDNATPADRDAHEAAIERVFGKGPA